MSKKDFVNGDDRLDRMLAEIPVEEAERFDAEADEMDRVHAMSLAMVREAGKRTQAEIARELKVTQGAVSQLEKRDDMLLSTLRSYLTATGAENPRILVTVNGHDVELAI
jgi:DNA-binding XRE family transcriptional regulator